MKTSILVSRFFKEAAGIAAALEEHTKFGEVLEEDKRVGE